METVQSEEAVAFQESVPGLMKTLLDNVDDRIIIGDSIGRIVFTNNSAIRINDDATLPVEPRERAHRLMLKIGPNEFPIDAKDVPLLKVLREGEVKDHELILLSSKGSKKILACNGRVLFDRLGKKTGAILIVHDNTRLRRA
jgi:PAS domain-containing protein